jgi:hypothetical protein
MEASQHTLSAAHQRPQKMLISLIVAPGEGPVFGELLGGEIESLPADHRRNLGHEDPLLLGQRD